MNALGSADDLILLRSTMRLTVQSFLLQSARVRRVLDYIDTHIDEDVTLARLADLACLSPSGLERLYFSKVRETPIATLRRLRLKRAYAQIRDGHLSLMDAALAASYGSQAAFTRAFVRQFGYAPSRLPSLASGVDLQPQPQLRLELMPARDFYQSSYSGLHREHGREMGHMVGCMAVGGAKRWRNWAVLDRDHALSPYAEARVDMLHFVPADGQPHGIRGIDRITHPGGLYAVHEALSWQQPRQLHALAEKIREELDCQIAVGAFGGRIILREVNVGGYTAPTERRTALYVPVAPLGATRPRQSRPDHHHRLTASP